MVTAHTQTHADIYISLCRQMYRYRNKVEKINLFPEHGEGSWYTRKIENWSKGTSFHYTVD